MADIREHLYLQKKNNSNVVCTDKWNIKVLKMPSLMQMETKDVCKRDWPEEDGEVVYNASELKVKSFDFDVELGTTGKMSDCQVNYKNMALWLTRNGLIFSLYSPYIMNGKSGCYLVKMSEPEIFDTFDNSNPYVFTWTMTVHCSNPLSTVKMSHELVSGKYEPIFNVTERPDIQASDKPLS